MKIKRLFQRAVHVLMGLVFFAPYAHATTSATVLTFSNQLVSIANDLTTGAIPTTVAMLALCGCLYLNFTGKGHDFMHGLINVAIVASLLIGAKNVLAALGLYSALFQ